MKNLLVSFYLVLFLLMIVLTARFFAYGTGNIFHLVLLSSVIIFSLGWVFEKNIA